LAYEFEPEAKTCLVEAARLDPTNPRWPYFHGLSLFPEATSEGLDQLRRAVELHADQDSSARNRLATILAELGEYREADAHFDRVLQRWPDDPAAVLGKGKIAFARGQLPESLQCLKRAASDPHTTKAALQLMATLQQRLGDTDAAQQTLQRLADQPDDQLLPDPFVEEASAMRTGRNAWLDYATKLYRRGQLAEARQIVDRAVKVYPESPDFWILLGRIQMREQQWGDARQSWQKAVQRAPEAVEAHMQLGVTQLRLGEAPTAIDCFRRAIHLKPNLGEGYHNLGLALATLDRHGEAAEAFREAIRLRPNFVDSYLGLADMLHRTGQPDGARQTIEQAQQLAPDDPRIGALRATLGL
jgi:tetratricopeptide (TPR) repeat protein